MKFEQGMAGYAANIFSKPYSKEISIQRYAIARGKEPAPEVVEEISTWVDRKSFGLEEIRKKKLALPGKPYNPELKAELLWIYGEQEKETLREMDEVRDATGRHILGEKPAGKNPPKKEDIN